jgi:hypothetical protein
MRKALALLLLIASISIVYANPVVLPDEYEQFTHYNTPSTQNLIISALIIALVVELPVSYIYLSIRKFPKIILISVLLANILSVILLQSLISYIFSRVITPHSYLEIILSPYTLIGEAGVVLLESAIIFLQNRRSITIKDAFTVSLLSNITSFLVGILILPSLF